MRRRTDSLAPGISWPPVIAALAAVYVIWGSTYFAIRVAIETLPPLLMAAFRFMVAGAAMYLWAVRRGDRRGDRPTAAHWRAALIVGGLLVAGGNGIVSWDEQYVPSGLTALVIGSVPLWIALYSRVVEGQRLGAAALAGIIVGLLGTGLLLRPGTPGTGAWQYSVILLAAPLSWAAGSLYGRRARLPKRQLVGTGMEMLGGGAIIGVAAVLTGELGRVHLRSASTASVLAVGYLIVFGSLVAFSSYVWLLRVAATSLVATYAYVNPLVAVVLGAAFLAEPVTSQTLVAGALVIVAVALILARPPGAALEAAEASDAGADVA